jgi:hypothetical protein
MNHSALIKEVIDLTPKGLPGRLRMLGLVFVALGVIGLGLGFVIGGPGAGWAALVTGTVVIIGVAMVGPLLSAVFEMTGSKWGRAYRRLAEGSVVLMPVGIIGVIVLLLGGNTYLPWVHEHPHVGGKALWLTRGFWDARVLLTLAVVYGVGLAFVRLSVRRDFCLAEVRERFAGPLGRWFARGMTASGEAEAARLGERMRVLAPVVAIVYAVAFTLLGFDLIMALEPDWFSTLFGAWYFIGNLFLGLALIAMVSVAIGKRIELDRFITPRRRSDMATLLLAFCLINVDFFWNQYLTIWYANLPEETYYVIERTVDRALPWRSLSFVSLATFFLIPFLALLFRKVKRNTALLFTVALVASVGVFLARFIEIAPALLVVKAGSGMGGLAVPLGSAVLLLVGFLGAGLLLYGRWLAGVPIMALNDAVFEKEFGDQGGRK